VARTNLLEPNFDLLLAARILIRFDHIDLETGTPRASCSGQMTRISPLRIHFTCRTSERTVTCLTVSPRSRRHCSDDTPEILQVRVLT